MTRFAHLTPLALALLAGIASTILLVLASISTPITSSISFLSAPISVKIESLTINYDIALGTFGYCIGNGQCTGTSLGYDLSYVATVLSNLGVQLGNNSIDSVTGISSSLLRTLTSILILHPIAGGLIGVSTIVAFVAIAPAAAPAAAATAAWLAGLASVVALLATVFDLVVFTIAINRIGGASRNVGDATVSASASYGAAVWMTLAACVLGCLATGFLIWTTRVARRTRRQRRRSSARGRYAVMGGDVEKTGATDDWVHRQSYHAVQADQTSPVDMTEKAAVASPTRVAVPTMAERSVPTSPTVLEPLSPSAAMVYASRPSSLPVSPIERSQPMVAVISTPVAPGLSSYQRGPLSPRD